MAIVEALSLTERPGAVRLGVHVKPKASRSKLFGVRAGALELAVAAPPVDGAANEAVRELLAEVLDVPKRDVALVGGASSRTKVFEVVGLDVGAVRARLAAALG